jgi:ankyrin repeat protein
MMDEDNVGTKVVHKTGISGNEDRDYSIINRVRSIDRTNDKFMKRTRSVSRTRQPPSAPGQPTAAPDATKTTITMKRNDSVNWNQRGTQAQIGGVLGVVRARSRSRAPGEKSEPGVIAKWRERSRSRARNEDSESRDDKPKKGFLRGRSTSRVRNFLTGRSSSKSKKKEKTDDSDRGRSKSRRDDGTAIATKKPPMLPPGASRNAEMLPPKAPVAAPEPEPVPEPKFKEVEPEVDDEIDKLLAERQLLAEVEGQTAIPDTKIETRPGIDSLNDHDVMQLDEQNTTMHVACLLHHSTSGIIDRLEEEPGSARISNKANETPLHYAAMDKKGVNKDVLKKLLQLYPEAVKQPNVQNSLPIHLACMVGAPSTYTIKTFLKMYPKAVMIQSDFPLLFEEDMVDTTENDDDSSAGSEFVSYRPKKDVTAVSGIASMFACAAPNQAAIEMADEKNQRREERNNSRAKREDEDDGPKVETGFSPLHLAVMNSAGSSVIELLIKVNPRTIHLKTSRGRTALDCAQYIVRQHWLYGTDDENAVENTFSAIDLLEKAMQEGDL